MSKSKKDKPRSSTVSITFNPDTHTLKLVENDKRGDLRISFDGNKWRIMEYGLQWSRWFNESYDGWAVQGIANTKWGLRREWRRLFGESKPFPTLTVWEGKA